MPATYVTEAELRSALGIGALYTSTVVEDVCQAAENIVKSKLNFNQALAIAHENKGTVGTLYFAEPHSFYVGQTVNVEGAGAKYNGNKTVNAIDTLSIKVTTDHLADSPYHPIVPYGHVYAETYTDYATLDEVRQATLMIAVDIWQARQASNAGGISPDFQPSPYRMGNTLMARVRGLLADHLAPGGQVG